MILVDCRAAWVDVAYWKTSPWTRVASPCSVSRNVCISVMTLSISCTEVAVARCSTELMLLATISLSFSGGPPRLVTTSRRTNSRISPCTSVCAGWSSSTVLRILRHAMFAPTVHGARDEHGNVTAWGPNEQNSQITECRKCGKDQGPRALL